MAFTWDWLLTLMVTREILNYYQLNVCDNYTDFVLYKMGRGKGILLYECHIIKRTSAACYRVMSFYKYGTFYRTCTSASDVCDYLIDNFIPDYIHKTCAERRLERETERAEQTSLEAPKINHGYGYLDGEDEFNVDCARWSHFYSKKKDGKK